MGLGDGWGMRHTVIIAPVVSQDVHGKPTYSTSPTTLRARVVGERRQGLDANRREVVSSQTVYLASGLAVAPDSQVTLTTAEAGSTEPGALTPPIVRTGRYPNEMGRQVYTALFLK